jgi:hypothetical protein
VNCDAAVVGAGAAVVDGAAVVPGAAVVDGAAVVEDDDFLLLLPQPTATSENPATTTIVPRTNALI